MFRQYRVCILLLILFYILISCSSSNINLYINSPITTVTLKRSKYQSSVTRAPPHASLEPPVSEIAPLPTPTSPLPHVGASGALGEDFGAVVAEQGLLGRVLCEEALPLDAPISPWAGEGGYGRAPGFEREDQVGEAAADAHCAGRGLVLMFEKVE